MFITKLFISSCFALFPSLVIFSSANRVSWCSQWLGGAPPAHPHISLAILCWNPSQEAQMLKQKLAACRLTCAAFMFTCLVAPAFSTQPACDQVFSLPCRLFGSVLAILLWVHVSWSMRGLVLLYVMNTMLILWIVSCFRTTAWQVHSCWTGGGLGPKIAYECLTQGMLKQQAPSFLAGAYLFRTQLLLEVRPYLLEHDVIALLLLKYKQRTVSSQWHWERSF